LATDGGGALVWEGGFEPFGRDWQEGTAAGAGENGVFLRLPGQWEDGTWEGASSGVGVYYNVHRWYQPQLGAYARPDPLDMNDLSDQTFAYARNQPTRFSDSLGLIAEVCCRLLGNVVAGTILRQNHCYVVADDGTVYGLYPEDVGGRTLGVPRVYDLRDVGGACENCELPPSCNTDGDQNRCLESEYRSYPVGQYRTLGPNSNTFAGTLARKCCKGGIPSALSNSPGLRDAPPQDTGLRPVPSRRSP
jgi:RHS repeat-associated protein